MRIHPHFTAPFRLLGKVYSLFYPNLCVACSRDIPPAGSCFCYPCRLKLQATDMLHKTENEFTDRLWGRLPLQTAAAMYYFSKGDPIQRALHKLKYKNQPDIGIKIGREFGRMLSKSPLFGAVDLIVPVPLHPKKERLRGYNQSAAFAQGLSETMYVPYAKNALGRGVFAVSQTKKNRMERFANIQEAFYVKQPSLLKGKTVLLVDDVLTTGATLESCGKLILEVPDTTLLSVTIAIAIGK